MRGDDPAFDTVLSDAITAAADLEGRAKRMSRGGLSRRAACANIVNTSAMLAKERNSHMSHHNTAPQYESADAETARPNLYLVTEASGAAAVAAVTHYEDGATGLDQMPFTD